MVTEPAPPPEFDRTSAPEPLPELLPEPVDDPEKTLPSNPRPFDMQRLVESFDAMRDQFLHMSKRFEDWRTEVVTGAAPVSERRPAWVNEILAAVATIETTKALQAKVALLGEQVAKLTENCSNNHPEQDDPIGFTENS